MRRSSIWHAGRFCLALLLICITPAASHAAERPNVVIIYCDDLGWGDVSPNGLVSVKMPSIDRLAAEGAQLTNFCSSCPYCAPSRVTLQTGRYQFRSGLVQNPAPPDPVRLSQLDPEYEARVQEAKEKGRAADELGIPDSEVTLGELFQSAGYYTACVGKWHLGHKPQFMPRRHGYEEYFGILYSNDMHPVQIYENERLYQRLVFQPGLTQRYTERACKIIKEHAREPFFLYLAHAMPHKPLAAGKLFFGRSGAGLYGDVLAELDWSVGQILKTLEDLEIDQKTLIIFSSDNGPWYGGRTGDLRGMKGQTWEGGIRVPLLARWPGKIPKGIVNPEPAVIADVFTTVLTAAEIPLPTDRPIDGKDLMPQFKDAKAKSSHDAIFSFRGDRLCTVRSGKWKLHLDASGPRTQKLLRPDEKWDDPRAPDGILILAPTGQMHPSQFPGVATGFADEGVALVDLEADPSEQKNVAAQNPDVVKRLQGYADKIQAEMPKKPEKPPAKLKSSSEAPSKAPAGEEKPAKQPAGDAKPPMGDGSAAQPKNPAP